MKKAIFLLTMSLTVVIHAPAQNTGFPANANLALPGFNNSFGLFFTNQLPNGLTTGNFNQMLLNLQGDLAQILPVLASVNDSFDFTSAGMNGLGTHIIVSSVGTGTTSTLINSAATANLGTSLGQDLSSNIGGQANAVVPGSTALGGGGPAISNPIAGNNTSGAVTAGFAFSSRRDVLRALIILQDDVEKMLPLVNALNGGNATTLNTLSTNNLGTVTTTPATPAPR
jgi:hypothetical protein